MIDDNLNINKSLLKQHYDHISQLFIERKFKNYKNNF